MSTHPARPLVPKYAAQIQARERKVCTVAFVDIVQSTAMIGDLDPEDALDRLAPAVELIIDTCEEFGASVRFVGDGALAAFGFPIADEHHCIRAVEAALTILERMEALQANRVDIRIGVHMGPVLFGKLSHANFDEVTLTGPVVHLADKIQAAGRSNAVTVSGTVMEAVGSMFVSRPAGLTNIQGMSQPFALFEIFERDEAGSRWKNRVERGLSPFHGREEHLNAIRKAWKDCLDHRGSSVLVSGEAGIGKSRLVYEKIRTLDADDACIFEISTTALDEKSAYAPLTRAIKQRLKVSNWDDQTEVTAKLSECLNNSSPDFRSHLSALQLVMGSTTEDSDWDALLPTAKQAAFLQGLLALVRSFAGNRPLVVVFEDLHWADAQTLSWIKELILQAPYHQHLVICTSRDPGVVADIPDEVLTRQELGPLDDQESENLIKSLLDRFGAIPEIERLVDKVSGHTPLFIEEIIRSLEASGKIKEGFFEEDLEVPESVQPLIAQRIDALSPDHRQTLEIAAVLGMEFSVELLSGVLKAEGRDIGGSLKSLEDLEFVENAEKPFCKFRHALIHQVAYGSLPKRKLRNWHNLSYEIVSSSGRASSLSSLNAVAYHAMKSQRWFEAAQAYTKCGYVALERAAFDEGVSFFERAIHCADQCKSRSDDIARCHIEARQGLRIAYVPKAKFAELLPLSKEIEETANRIGYEEAAFNAGIDQVIMLTVISDVRLAIQKGEDLIRIAERRDMPGFTAAAAFGLAQAYWFHGALEDAKQTCGKFKRFFTRGVDKVSRGTTGSVSILGLGTYANTLSLLGEYDASEQVCDLMNDIQRSSEKQYDYAYHAISKGILELSRGEFEASIQSLEEAQSVCSQSKIDALSSFLSAPLAEAQLRNGDITKTRDTLEMGKAIARRSGMSAFAARLMMVEIDLLSHLSQRRKSENMMWELRALCERNGYTSLLRRIEARMPIWAGGQI